MPICHRCQKGFKGDELYCEPCEEFLNQVRREEHGIVCWHCGGLFTPGGFDQHRWSIYYRDHQFPRGRRQRRR